MKTIDLLNKIANGEEVPDAIKWGCHDFKWFVYEYKAKGELGEPTLLDYLSQCPQMLNDEVEVCSTGLTVKEAEENLYKFSEALYKEANKKREKKIPEKLKIEQIDAETFLKSPINIEVNELYIKTRELIDEVNKLKEK